MVYTNIQDRQNIHAYKINIEKNFKQKKISRHTVLRVNSETKNGQEKIFAFLFHFITYDHLVV